ncbi:lipoyl(octanoyl) transferase LipB [Halanaerobium sp. Z-7514]|uniref:Octanoyltransferase n=1 Tax=Halanaerobium polyolivorans TaxID=2886943 RepID=A0AAW4WWS6_9FIRM|nr:lipoyl(octanoyl) transferase LipB [Halanaerobium polyolivorans]MCC3144326.1 lipoyl(octanoyl) transferase LipB [Halanaerobium polyolivorans]RQD76045.1 MAG: lipoyl(octanoyl) transferase LipB [Halanaerobium sp. MSAO_Bac5]
MTVKLNIKNLGILEHQKAYQLQLEMLKKRIANQIEDTLLIVEHPPVYTIGTSGSRENIRVSSDFLNEAGIKVYETNRGGDITYHGPGQIVIYPILNLKNHKKDLHWLLRSYEEVFIKLLKDFAIDAQRIDGLTGVWVGNEKITAIGVAVRRWVSYHGCAFNLSPNLEHFSYIVPCGITDKGVTSLEKLLGRKVETDQVIELLIKNFKEVFAMEVINYEK